MKQLFSYWQGPITWMERASVQSALNMGYDVTVYSFQPTDLMGQGLGKIADARDLMNAPMLERFRKQLPAHFSDLFRVEGLSHGCGTWFDLDVIFLKPLPETPYLFGWENDKTICNAVLRLPIGCPMLAEYRDLCRAGGTHRAPPWYPWHKRINRHVKGIIREWQGRPRPLPMLGPRTLTYLVHKHGLEELAYDQPMFYPVRPERELVNRMREWSGVGPYIKPDTVCIHLWRSFWHQCHGTAAPNWDACSPAALVQDA
jgi:hypothetical protein